MVWWWWWSLVACLVVAAGSCPSPSNLTLDHILEGNPHLKAVFEGLEAPQGFLAPEGLRSLLTTLILRTACPSHSEGTEGDAEGGHDHDDHHVGHRHEDHESLESPHDHPQMKGKMVDPSGDGRGQDLPDLDSEALHSHQGINLGETDAVLGTKNCSSVEDVIAVADFKEDSSSLPPEQFLLLCPSILNSLLSPPCPRDPLGETVDPLASVAGVASQSPEEHGYDHKGHNHHHRNAKGTTTTNMTKDAWIAAILSMVVIGLIGLLCIMIIPVLKRSRYYILINHFLLALAVGSLAGDALIHLLPHAMTMEIQLGLNGHLAHALYGFTSFLGILLFLLMERLHNLIGHKHSHGHHAHDSPPAGDGDELVKEIGLISAELNEPSAQHFDKIGEKLSQHSKHSSFICADSNSPSEQPQRSCFESCPPNLGAGPEDANGNSGNLDSMVCKPRAVDHNSVSMAECERLVTSQPWDKSDQISSSKTPLTPIPPPPLVQSSPPKSLVRQESKNFNMVLQEYHVGHHGHSHHGHSHVTGKKNSLRTMILLGDGIHTFMDGMAIGAAFGTNLTGGIATAIAVLCHELPHKVGDFAILFEMGMKRRQAMKMVVGLWALSLLGLVVGVSIGSIKEVSPWIYCFTAGVFLYLALVDLLSELSINSSASCGALQQMALQVAGLLTGAGIMLVIAIYEHDLEYLLEGAF